MTIQGRRKDDQEDPLLVRIGEAARLLGISERHVWELVLCLHEEQASEQTEVVARVG